MDSDLEIFNFFVEDLLSSEIDLLKNELDLLLMQYIFNSIDLNTLNNINVREDVKFAS